MWQDILNIVPRPLVLACVIYGAATWFVTGPIVAELTAEARYYPACVAGLKAQPLPKSAGEELLDELRKSPLLQDPLMRSLGIDRYLDLAKPRNQGERKKSVAEMPVSHRSGHRTLADRLGALCRIAPADRPAGSDPF